MKSSTWNCAKGEKKKDPKTFYFCVYVIENTHFTTFKTSLACAVNEIKKIAFYFLLFLFLFFCSLLPYVTFRVIKFSKNALNTEKNIFTIQALRVKEKKIFGNILFRNKFQFFFLHWHWLVSTSLLLLLFSFLLHSHFLFHFCFFVSAFIRFNYCCSWSNAYCGTRLRNSLFCVLLYISYYYCTCSSFVFTVILSNYFFFKSISSLFPLFDRTYFSFFLFLLPLLLCFYVLPWLK